ncbi:MAG: phosphoribosylformylglycinamidine synthase [Candidatus Lokiarchaeota archaeon]|nr:phosphoribosylformylglycinamidine synthase [Candidatus Lokiarchaeota archaeon]
MVDVCILTGYGINSDYESKYAFELAGAENVQRVHVNKFINNNDLLDNYQILMFPGGFSFGDHLGSGRVLANKFRYSLREELTKYIQDGKLIFGVCNGFQILVKMGLLPALKAEYYKQTVSLVGNKSGQFESRWITLKPHDSKCIWTKGYNANLELPVRHGEGQFVVKNKEILKTLWRVKMIPFTYTLSEYPANPNGSIDDIAGICDETGRIFGMMPHPECHLFDYHHPEWTRGYKPEINGLKIFQNAVGFIRDNYE